MWVQHTEYQGIRLQLGSSDSSRQEILVLQVVVSDYNDASKTATESVLSWRGCIAAENLDTESCYTMTVLRTCLGTSVSSIPLLAPRLLQKTSVRAN